MVSWQAQPGDPRSVEHDWLPLADVKTRHRPTGAAMTQPRHPSGYRAELLREGSSRRFAGTDSHTLASQLIWHVIGSDPDLAPWHDALADLAQRRAQRRIAALFGLTVHTQPAADQAHTST